MASAEKAVMVYLGAADSFEYMDRCIRYYKTVDMNARKYRGSVLQRMGLWETYMLEYHSHYSSL